MKLSEQESDLFLEVMWPLQHYVCGRLGVVPGVDSLEDFKALGSDQKFLVRESLFDNPQLVDEFIAENPAGLGEEQLSVAQGWKHFVRGDFYMERFLKNYAIFIQSERVYAVSGIHNSFDEMFPKSYLPMLVKATLLPIRDKIVYDGFLNPYNLFFGNEIKSELRETYLMAKQDGKIIFSLPATGQVSPVPGPEPVQPVDWSRELQQLTAISRTLKGGAGQPAINAVVFGLVKSSIAFTKKALSSPSDSGGLFTDFDKVEKAVKKVREALYRMEQ
ncbi:MAG: hypothetical protein BECKG1743D_GA0114223_102113 [Candidatus Kentron sp. G]|nr:MAG: hypothetical protein BECKG1743F_GA0114225_101353 [Candidatus Kentron sp. G]VFM98518.1 MAG: hypothetical protein BECKG1743E_GA0114224_101943 [Candidatus Kentron sp. G]VFN00620.1 MAG: hypothetical protein BECKG1743D_GA0114223_102113 [Candidatus Kentron sp. G]